MDRIRSAKNRVLARLWYEMAFYPFYVMLLVVLALWLAEGAAEQSGWISCPRP